MVLSVREPAPFQLDRGLYLEKAKCLLPWDASLDTLKNIAAPKFIPPPPQWPKARGFLGWKDEMIFDGLRADIWYGQGGVQNAFTIDRQNLEQVSTAREAFVFYRDYLTPKLGEPKLSLEKDVQNIEYPCAQWWFGNVRISVAVGERFTEYLAFQITKGIGKP